jgi:hypothetical protein
MVPRSREHAIPASEARTGHDHMIERLSFPAAGAPRLYVRHSHSVKEVVEADDFSAEESGELLFYHGLVSSVLHRCAYARNHAPITVPVHAITSLATAPAHAHNSARKHTRLQPHTPTPVHAGGRARTRSQQRLHMRVGSFGSFEG